jgi:hypothetical protein
MRIDTSSEKIDRKVAGGEQLLRLVVSAGHRQLRHRRATEAVDQGVDLVFECGIVATCRRCRLTWRVDGIRDSRTDWWLCPARCSGGPVPSARSAARFGRASLAGTAESSADSLGLPSESR